MTRVELLNIAVAHAVANGFDLRRWYTQRLGVAWTTAEDALTLLDQQRRYYALVFSHDFAQAFWTPGSMLMLRIERKVYQRIGKDGRPQKIRQKPFTRKTLGKDAWKFHLAQMARSEEPLRYLRRFLPVIEDLEPDDLTATARQAPPPKPMARALPTEPPAFLRKLYKGVPAEARPVKH